MDADLWVKLQKSVKTALSSPEVAGVAVSHGTDTLFDVLKAKLRWIGGRM